MLLKNGLDDIYYVYPSLLSQEIISKNSSPDSGGGPLAPAYLLSIMIDHASKHLDPALTPQILLKSANLIKEIVWVSLKKRKSNSSILMYVLKVRVRSLISCNLFTVSLVNAQTFRIF